MALDVGDRRTGIAVTDPSRTIVSPHAVIEEPSRARAIAAIAREVEALQPVLIVTGLPLDAAGRDTDQARRVRVFAGLLAEAVTVPIVFQDESHTTGMAEETLAASGRKSRQWKQVVDKVAAAKILQAWLDGHPDYRVAAQQQQQQQQQQ